MIFDRSSIKITNICANVNFECHYNLKKILTTESEDFHQFKFDFKRFSGLRCKLKNSRIAVLIFANGKINIVGAKSKADIELCIEKLMNFLKITNKYLKSYKIYNFCASYDAQSKIDLKKIAEMYKLASSLEPELFAGLIFTNKKQKFTIHRTGIIFGTGFKNFNDINQEFDDLFDKINKSNAFVGI